MKPKNKVWIVEVKREDDDWQPIWGGMELNYEEAQELRRQTHANEYPVCRTRVKKYVSI
jgi:hypothetical protein